MKHPLRLILTVLCWGACMPVSVLAASQSAELEPDKPLKIVFDNDVHGSIDRYTYLAGYRDALKQAGYPVLTVSAGDFLQGSSYATMSKGRYCVDVMNAVGYDVVAVGNHDIDYGLPRLMQLRDSLTSTAMVCANLYDANNKRCLPSCVVTTVDGYRVAFVGVLTTATEMLQANVVFDPSGQRQCSFAVDSLVQVVQKAIDQARKSKPDWVVLLTHMGVDPLDKHLASWQLLEKLRGVDAIIDGHSHTVINTSLYQVDDDKTIAIAQTGFGMANVGCLTLERGQKPSVKLYSYKNLPQSAKVQQVYQHVLDQVQPILGQVVGYTPFDLNQSIAGVRVVRNQETNLGDLVADAYRAELGTDIGWVNGGGVRHGIEVGDITYGQVLSVSPFCNFMCIAQVSGQMLADALEECYHKCPADLGSFAQISGLRCKVDTTIQNALVWDEQNRLTVKGERRVSDIQILKDGKWRAVEKDEYVTIASSDYVVYEGESQGLKQARILKDKVTTDTECFQSYIMNTLKGVIPEQYRSPQGRIVFK